MNLGVCRHVWRTTVQFSRLLRQAKGAGHLSQLHFLSKPVYGKAIWFPEVKIKLENPNNRTIFAEWTFVCFGAQVWILSPQFFKNILNAQFKIVAEHNTNTTTVWSVWTKNTFVPPLCFHKGFKSTSIKCVSCRL